MSSALKIVVTGDAGVGKSTAIRTVSDGRVNTTEVNSRAGRTVTAALDYAEVDIEPAHRLRLFGAPGEARYEHMHGIVARGASGIVLLIDNSAADPVGDCIASVQRLRRHDADLPVVVGITRSEICIEPGIGEYGAALAERGMAVPLLTADTRQRDDLLGLLDVLLMQIDDDGDEPMEWFR